MYIQSIQKQSSTSRCSQKIFNLFNKYTNQYLITLFAVLNKSFIFSLHKIKYLTKINLERKITY